MAELENNPQVQHEVKQEEKVQENPVEQVQKKEKTDSVDVSSAKIVEYACYTFAVLFLIAAVVIYNKDLHCSDGPFDFHEQRYVGGDAYNYIISAARSSAIMVKSLIMTVSGFSFVIIGRLTALINKK